MNLRIAAIGLVVLAALVFVFLSLWTGGDEEAPAVADLPHATAAAPDQPAAVSPSASVESARVRLEESAAEPEEPEDARGVPASWRAALGVIVGRIVEEDRAPVAALEIELLALTAADMFADREGLFANPPAFGASKGTTVTDADGRFRFESIDPLGMCLLGVDLGGSRGTCRLVDHMPGRGEIVDLGDIVLEPYVTLVGRVEDEDGEAVGGARVRALIDVPALVFEIGLADLRGDGALAWQDDSSASGYGVLRFPAWVARLIERFPAPTTKTAEDGSFTLPGVGAGVAQLVVDASGYVTKVQGPVPTGKTGGTRDVGTIRVEFGETLAGRVEDAAGEPVVGADVFAGRQSDLTSEAVILRPAGPTGRTDADGRFELDAASDGDHMVAVRRPGDVDWTIEEGLTPGTEGVVIRLDQAHTLTLTAHDPAGTVVPKPTLLLGHEEADGIMTFLEPPLPLAGRVTYDDQGAAVVAGLGAGSYHVLVRADGFAVAELSVDLSAGDVSEHVTLQKAHALDVAVTAAATDEPVGDARVYATPADTEDFQPTPWSAARTAADGTAKVAGLPEGRFSIRVVHPAYAAQVVTADVPGRALEVKLVKGGSIAGRLHEGGRPIAEPRMIGVSPSDAMFSFPRIRLTDLEGNFEITGLAPGEWTLHVQRRLSSDRGLERSLIGSGLFSMSIPERTVELVVVDGQETQIDIDLLGASEDGPSGFVRGRVTLNGQPAHRCAVHAISDWDWSHSKSAQTDETGAFDLGALPAGKEVRVTFTPQGVGTQEGFFGGLGFYSRILRLEGGATENLVVHLRTGHMEGKVVRADNGEPIPFAEVRVISEEGRAHQGMQYMIDGEQEQPAPPPTRGFTQQNTTADARGEFRFELLPEDSYIVSAQSDTFRPGETGPVSVPYGGAPPQVVVRMQGAVALSGTLELPAASDGHEVWLLAKSDTGVFEVADYDRESGKFEFENLAPGRYELNVESYSSDEDNHTYVDYAPVIVDVPETGLTNFVLRPQLEK